MKLAVIDLSWIEEGVRTMVLDNSVGKLSEEAALAGKLGIVMTSKHFIKSAKPIESHIDKAFWAGVQAGREGKDTANELNQFKKEQGYDSNS